MLKSLQGPEKSVIFTPVKGRQKSNANGGAAHRTTTIGKKKSLMGYAVAKLLLGQHLNGGHKANGFKIILNCGIKLFHIRTILMGFTYRFRGCKDIQRHCKCLPDCQGKGNHQGFF